jgi:DNA-binding transcriptional LysR family regulator
MINFRLIRHLWLFLAVAEEQHFGRAARRLGMSQPPLTAQIQVLEQALQAKLFERSRRGTQLTPVGRAIVPAVRKLADQLEHLERTVREAVAGQSGVLTIGAITSAMLESLPPLLAQYRQQHPGLSISVREIDSAEAITALEAGDIDLAFARVPGQLSDPIDSLRLADDQVAVALPRSHRLADQACIGPADLADEVFVMFARDSSPIYFDSLMAICHAHGVSLRILHEVRSVAAQLAFVGCGQGLALVPLAFRDTAPPHVVVRPLAGDARAVTTTVAWHRHRLSAPLLAMLEIIRQQMAARSVA